MIEVPGIVRCCALVALGCGTVQQVSAQTWPARPVRVIVPFPPGQAADIVTRLLTEPLSTALGRQVVVDNRPGAGTLIGTELAARSAPDGYTVLAGGSSSLTINPHLYRNLTYDTLKDFSPITNIHTVSFVFCVNPSLPARSIQELIALARKQPGAVTYGSAGNASTSHLAQAMFAAGAGVTLTHVPYKGAVASLTDLMGGQIALVAEVAPAALPHVKSGKLRALGVSSATRLPFLPDVATLQEQGVKDYVVVGWTSLVAPAGTPDAILDRLNAEVVKILGGADMRKRFGDLGLVPVGDTREHFGAFLRTELAKWGNAVRISGAKVE